ncbi:MAG TPA: GGDEF domain-containing protein [Limnochordales bacterium]
MHWRREAVWGCLLGAALGAGVHVGRLLIELGTQRDLTHRMPYVYMALLAIGGGVSGSLWANLREQAITDSLTGLYNRRHFENELQREIARARRTGSVFSVLILDVDDFKHINDRFGHKEGDRVLRRVADTLRRACRRTDVVARWGGEEFAVLLPDTAADGAQQAGQRLVEAVLEATGVTMSVGWATSAEDAATELLDKADQRMYEEKRAKAHGQKPQTG